MKTPHKNLLKVLSPGLCLLLWFCSTSTLAAQKQATISEYNHIFKTYPFDDPDPVPILTTNPKIYPYFKYEGYKHDAEMKDWKVIKLENDYIEVYVLPEVGGKIWGAIEKSTGEEFIYRNEVMKFRNIAMRGPWTSGGIEFNFGIIGHHPSTSTPVDYTIQNYDDGSVSCTVGAIDLPSRTQWRVEVLLAPDKAFFETRVLWYNPTHHSQAYYNWMTGAAVASDDLEFFCPGTLYVGHPGDPHAWPVDEDGRNLNIYKENNFGGSKSYHVVGEYNDFFGGYYHDRQFGFGHWSPYDEMPGQKLWLWALSRSGGIWEDLLTDTDGQYIEFQAGRLLNQFSPGREQTPITQVDFEPGRSDLWREIWFPVKKIGGLSDVSPKGILHIVEDGDSLVIGINALEKSAGQLLLKVDDLELMNMEFDLMPMDVKTIKAKRPDGIFIVEVGEMDLYYKSENKDLKLDRDFTERKNPDVDLPVPTATSLCRQGMEEMKFRNYATAEDLFLQCLKVDHENISSLNSLADLKLRSALYAEALTYIKRALQIDTYDADGNFIAGKIYTALDQKINALECFGWAARSLKYRADAYAAMAEIHLKNNELENATRYARNALDFNRFHFGARIVLTVASRVSGNTVAAIRQISGIRALDPLNHFAKMEQFLISKLEGDKQAFLDSHRSELTYQTFLELAILYYNLGRNEDAVAVLDLAPQHALIDLWWSYLMQEKDPEHSAQYLSEVTDLSSEMVFPYRPETIKVLEWASANNESWQVKYYLALNHWALGHQKEALNLLNQLEEKIHFAPLYLARGDLREKLGESGMHDLEHALLIDKSNWRAWDDLLNYYQSQGMQEKYIIAAKEANERLPDNYVIAMQYARSLIDNKQYIAAVDALEGVNVLPFEGASLGRQLWEDANLAAGLEFIKKGEYVKSVDLLQNVQQWPENLGVGKPYNPDDRIADYLLSYSYQKIGKPDLVKKHQQAVMDHKSIDTLGGDLEDLINIKLEKSNSRNFSLREIPGSERRGVVNRYLKAYQVNDRSKMQELEINNPELFSNLTFQIIKAAIELP